MHEAAARERDEVRLLLAPARQRRRPLARAPHLVHLLAGEDDAAVDDAGRDRGELARRHGTMASSSSARPSCTRPALISMWPCACRRQRESLAVAEALGHRGRLAATAAPASKSPCASCWNDERHEHVAVLDRSRPPRPRAAAARARASRRPAPSPRAARGSCRSRTRSATARSVSPARDRRGARAPGRSGTRRRGRA